MSGAAWIGPVEADVPPPGERPALWLRKEFTVVDSSPTTGATLTLAARGLVEVFLNGERIGDELLPGYTQYDRRLPRRSYDVSSAVLAGANAIVILIADGWFRGQTGATRAADQWGTATSAWLEIRLDEGTIAVATDATWRSAPSHVLAADLIAGQREDRRRLDPTVVRPGFDDSAWAPVVVAEVPTVPLVDRTAPAVRRVEELAPIAVTELGHGVHLVDLGQNINGWLRLGDLGPAGTELTITHGEALDAEGDLTTDHLRVDFPFLPAPLPAGQIDRVISAGVPGDTFEPRLTTHGFRYARIEGHPGPLGPDDVRGIVVHSDLRRIGRFACSDERVGRLHEAAVWSLRGNVCEIPTDCPHRERLGWSGDWQIFCPTAAFLYDVDAFTRHWLADVRLAQADDGMIRNHAPSTPAEGLTGPAAALQGSAGWGDVIVMAPWALYEAYGSAEPLAENYEAMQRWLAFGAEAAGTRRSSARIAANPEPAPHEAFLWDTGFHWGEWLEPGSVIADFGAFVAADKSEVATAYLHRSARTMAQIAEVLGRPAEESDHYRRLAAGTLDAWQCEFIGADGALVVQTQASHVRALAFDLTPERLRPAIADRLAEIVREAGTTVGTGFLSTPYLLPALADNGHLDLAYELLLQPDAPGWMAMIDRGATTVWEHWEGIDADGVPHESLNHYSKGAVISFLHRYVAGLTPTEPGYTGFEVRPRPGGGIDHVEQSLETPNGTIELEWTRSRQGLDLTVEVPTGSRARVILPSGRTVDLDRGRHQLHDAAPAPDRGADPAQ